MRSKPADDFTQAITANTKAVEKLTETLERMVNTLTDHEVRITRLENKDAIQ